MSQNSRESISPKEIVKIRREAYAEERTKELYANLALPSYVHGYSLAIQYMYDWFESKFDKGYFKGGIYVDGKHVLDDYKHFSKNVIKGQNPRARMAPTVDYDFDREGVDMYGAPPELYLRRSNFQEGFFKDYDRDMYLGLNMRQLRMNFDFKVRVNTRAQQQDIYNKMELNFRIGATMSENISVDFHVPKDIMLAIAERAGFEIRNNEVVNIIDFLAYVNSHSEIPFLFKMRAINQKAEFFIRLNGLYTHISCKDKLRLDDGEQSGKLMFNYHVEMTCVLSIPIPHFYSFYSAEDIMKSVTLREQDEGAIAVYSINAFDIPKVDENNWMMAATVDYITDDGETYIDLSDSFSGNNPLSLAVNHDLTKGISPSHFINIKIYKNADVAKECPITMDWKRKVAYFDEGNLGEQTLHIVLYYDKEYINTINSELNNYNKSRIKGK